MATIVVPTPAGRDGYASWLASRSALWTLIGVSTLLRVVWACNLGPAVDEAYYFQYIQHPALSYFDHPPMVALVGAPGVWLAGDAYSLMGLRLGFIVLFAGSTWLMARLTTRYYGPRAGFCAALALNATGYFGMAVGTIPQPDGPLLFFWLLTLDRLAVALENPDRVTPWLGVGIAWGGAMLSKYHAVLLPVGAVLYLVFRPRALRCLKQPGPYLAVIIGAIMFTPVIAWNATHGWASFLFQGGRASTSTGLRLDNLAVAVGGEVLYLFPWIWIPLVVLLFKLVRRGPRSWDDGETFLLSQAVPALVLFHAVATFQRIMAYWPLFGFISLIPLLGRDWAAALEVHPRAHRRWMWLVAVTPVVLATLVSIQTQFGLFSDGRGRILGLIPPRNDPTIDMICWDQVAAELERRGILAKPNTFLFTDTWDRSSRLALAVRGKVPVACYNFEARSYAFWSRPEDLVGRDGIFAEDARSPGQIKYYAAFFRKYEPIGTARIIRQGAVVREIYLYRGTYQTWPFPFDGRIFAKNPKTEVSPK